jgi:8-oxo-dGTP pyrophosphatase MutT (NUDIX family)
LAWIRNEHWQRYSFVGGHKRPDESFRDCMIREIAEELLLGEGRDFLVADRPLARLEYTAWSQSAGQETRYTIELFQVQLQGDAIRTPPAFLIDVPVPDIAGSTHELATRAA